ncbi:MAG: autotransporter-associated beta strand repeat-containing protein [Verrucomicrobiota bacterium]
MKLKLSILAFAAVSVGNIYAQQYWKTDGTSGTWTGANWDDSADGPFSTSYSPNTNAQFTADSIVTFATASIGNVTVADNKTVTITAAGTLSTNSTVRTFDVGAGATLTWTGQNWTTTAGIGFIKNGAGIWNIGAQSNALNATNGGFTLNAGTVIVGGNNSFGGSNSALAINGGTIQSSGTRAYANSAITIGGNFTNSGTGNATFSGTVNLGGATRTITNSTTSGSRIYSGVISGISGSGLTFDGAGVGVTYIGNASNSYTGTISINGSEVGFASNGAFGNAANTIIVDGGVLSAASTAGAAASYTLASTHGIQVGSTAGTSISAVSGGTLTYDGIISDKSGSTGAWAKQGTGTLALGGISTYTGATAINGGTLQLTTGNNRLPTGTTVSLGQSATISLGTLDLNGFNQQIAGLNSTTGTNAGAGKNTVTSTSAATLTLGGTGTYSYGNGTAANSGIIAGSISLAKTGSGTQTLGDANTYTGTTIVNGGTLLIGTSGSLANTIVTVGGASATGTPTLGGGGTIGGATTISSAGVGVVGTHAPGIPGVSGGVGTQTFSSTLNYGTGSIFEWDLNAASTTDPGSVSDVLTGTYDQVVATGVATGGAAVFKVVLGGNAFADAFWDSDKSWTNIFTGAGAPALLSSVFGSFSATGGLDANGVVDGRGQFTFNGSSATLNWTAVPEPTSALAGLLLGAGLLRRRRVA